MQFKFQFLNYITHGDFEDIFMAYDWFREFAAKGHIDLEDEYKRDGNKYYNFAPVKVVATCGKVIHGLIPRVEAFKKVKESADEDNIHQSVEQPEDDSDVAVAVAA